MNAHSLTLPKMKCCVDPHPEQELSDPLKSLFGKEAIIDRRRESGHPEQEVRSQ